MKQLITLLALLFSVSFLYGQDRNTQTKKKNSRKKPQTEQTKAPEKTKRQKRSRSTTNKIAVTDPGVPPDKNTDNKREKSPVTPPKKD